MRIAISGVSCTGKTTLLDELIDIHNFKNYRFCKNIVRDILAKGFKINKEADDTTQILITNTHLNNVLFNDNLISDRCFLDSHSYARWGFKHNIITEEVYNYSQYIFNTFINRYDIIFYLPIEFDIIPDGVRNQDNKYREIVNDYYKQNIELIKTKVVTLTGNVTQRINTIHSAIHGLKNHKC